MIKILFICLDDEYFAPMTKMVMRDLVAKVGLEAQILVDSAGVNRTATGKSLKDNAKAVLTKNGITPSEHQGRCFFDIDFYNYNLIVVLDMVSAFVIERRLGDERQIRLARLMSFAGEDRDVADPFDTHEDDSTFADIKLGCQGILEIIQDQIQRKEKQGGML